MSAFGLILNLLLGGLLVAALGLGLRLDRRLKALRESQASFIAAVADLDEAAARTREGLDQWREATDEARELLHDRIEKAKVQTARLEKAIAEALRTPEPTPLPPPPVDDAMPARLLETLKAVQRLDPRREAAFEPRADARSDVRPEPRAPSRPPPVRSRASIDDDLFDSAPLAGAVELQRNLAASLGRQP